MSRALRVACCAVWLAALAWTQAVPARLALEGGDYAGALRELESEADLLEAARVRLEVYYLVRDFPSTLSAAQTLAALDPADPRPLGLGAAAALYQQDGAAALLWLQELEHRLGQLSLQPEARARWVSFAEQQRPVAELLVERQAAQQRALLTARIIVATASLLVLSLCALLVLRSS